MRPNIPALNMFSDPLSQNAFLKFGFSHIFLVFKTLQPRLVLQSLKNDRFSIKIPWLGRVNVPGMLFALFVANVPLYSIVNQVGEDPLSNSGHQ